MDRGFLARTNPIMFLLFGSLLRRTDEARYRELLESGPYGLGRNGYLLIACCVLAPLVLTVMVTALSGQPPGHVHVP